MTWLDGNLLWLAGALVLIVVIVVWNAAALLRAIRAQYRGDDDT